MTYRFVERPIRKRASTVARRWTVPGLSAAMATIAGCALLVVAAERVSSASAYIPHVADVSRRHLGLGLRRQQDHPRR